MRCELDGEGTIYRLLVWDLKKNIERYSNDIKNFKDYLINGGENWGFVIDGNQVLNLSQQLVNYAFMESTGEHGNDREYYAHGNESTYGTLPTISLLEDKLF